MMAAWHDERPGVGASFYVGLAYGLLFTALLAGLGIGLWRLWTEVLAGIAL